MTPSKKPSIDENSPGKRPTHKSPSRKQVFQESSTRIGPQEVESVVRRPNGPTEPLKNERKQKGDAQGVSKPLFGEVFTGSPNWTDIGFGIPRHRVRRGSDGSMHHPNAMFPHSRSLSNDQVSPTKVNGFSLQSRLDAETFGTLRLHQRSASDMGHDVNVKVPENFSSLRNIIPASQLQTLDERKGYQRTSNAPPSPPNHQVSSRLGNQGLISLRDRRPVTPPALLSYKNRDVSPSKSVGYDHRLKAIIKEPSPKKSPPLRSSRPRQQVSATSGGLELQDKHGNHDSGVGLGAGSRMNGEDQDITATATAKNAQAQKNAFVENLQPQLSNAVYQKGTPQLSLSVPNSQHHQDGNPSNDATTDFEDESPLSTIPGSFPQEEAPKLTTGDPALPESTTWDPSSVALLGSFQSTQDTDANQAQSTGRNQGTAPKRRAVPYSSSKIIFPEEEDAGTIQIMLGESTLIDDLSQDQANPGQQIERDSRLNKRHEEDSTPIQSDASSAERSWGPTSRRADRLTPDTDQYSAYLRLLDEYREKGSFSPDMKREYSEYILSAFPTASPEEIEEAWEKAKTQLPQDFELFQQSRADSFISAASELDEDQISAGPTDKKELKDMTGVGNLTRTPTESPKVYATMRGTRISDLNDYFSKYREEGSATPVGEYAENDERPKPPPKDEPESYESQASHNRSSAHTFRSVNSDHPSLPEIQDTGGGLDLALPGTNTDQVGKSTSSHHSGDDSMAEPDDQKLPINKQESSSRQNPPPVSAAQSASFRSQSTTSGTALRDENNKNPSQNKDERRLKHRLNLINELINTEYTYNQDMTIVEDIYLATAPSVGDAMGADDIRVLFGNMRQIVNFSRSLADALKDATRSVYVRPKNLRWQRTPSGKNSAIQNRLSSSDSGQMDYLKEGTDDDRDRRTRIGNVFLEKMQEMEKVYSEYLKNHDHANQRLHKLQKADKVKLWLNECHQYAKDITAAWDLDSLLVKPTQRVLKYPLLLNSLFELTPADHPDHIALRAANLEIRKVSSRINESKKRAELLEQIVSTRGRKDVDLSKGITKAFGRRKEKLRQQVGVSEAFLDDEYRAIAQKFNGHLVQIEVVMKDYERYKSDATEFIKRYNQLVEVIEEIIDIKESPNPEIESKWRRFATTIRELTAIAFADHMADVQKLCIDPLLKLWALHGRPQELMRDHKERLVDYAKYKNLKDRNEQPDKKTTDQGEQFLALNETLKDELPKLFALNGRVNEECLKNYVFLNSSWHLTWQDKLKTILDDLYGGGHEKGNLPHFANIVKAFRRDYEYYEQDVLSLSICNGSALAGSSNFLSSSTKSSSTLADGAWDSHRPSTGSRRGTSASNQTSPGYVMPEHFGRHSGSSVTLSPHHTNPRPSTEGGSLPNQPSNGSGLHQRYRSGSGGAALSRAPPPRLPSNTGGTGTFYLGHSPAPTPPLATTSAQSYDMAGRHSDPPMRERPRSGSTFHTANAHAGNNPTQTKQYMASPQVDTPTVFSSALPMDVAPHSQESSSVDRPPAKILFIAVSLFDFTIDKARKEAGHPYLTYMPGEVC